MLLDAPRPVKINPPSPKNHELCPFIATAPDQQKENAIRRIVISRLLFHSTD